MNETEFALYSICEEFHPELRKRFDLKATPIELVRVLLKKLTQLQIHHTLYDMHVVRKRKGNAGNYYILLIYPFIVRGEIM